MSQARGCYSCNMITLFTLICFRVGTQDPYEPLAFVMSQRLTFMEKLCCPAHVTHSTKATFKSHMYYPGVGADHDEALKRYSNCQAKVALVKNLYWEIYWGKNIFLIQSFFHLCMQPIFSESQALFQASGMCGQQERWCPCAHRVFILLLLLYLFIYFFEVCRRSRVDSWVGKIPWRRERLPIPVFWVWTIPWTV